MTYENSNTNEIWRDVVGYESVYSVSNFGRVCRHLYFRGHRTKILKPKLEKTGYLRLSLSCKNIVHTHSVHKLVAEAFIGKRPQDLVINHIDGNKQNNRSDNLEYITNKANMEHAAKTNLLSKGKKHGRFVSEGMTKMRGHYAHLKPELVNRGEKHGGAKITENIAKQVISLLKAGIKAARIARQLGVNYCIVYDIKRGRTWRHLS